MVFSITCMACNLFGFFSENFAIIASPFYLLKTVEGVFMVGGIVWYIFRGVPVTTSFVIFSSIGTASFVLAYILRYPPAAMGASS